MYFYKNVDDHEVYHILKIFNHNLYLECYYVKGLMIVVVESVFPEIILLD